MVKLVRVRFARHICPVQAPGGAMVTQLGEGYVLELRDGVVSATATGPAYPSVVCYPLTSVESWVPETTRMVTAVVDAEPLRLDACPYCPEPRGKGETCGSRSCRAKLREERRRAQDAQELTTEKS